MKKIFLLLTVISWSCGAAQPEKEVIYDQYLSLWRIDDNICYELDNKRKKIFWNGKAIDSTGVDIEARIFHEDGFVGVATKAKDEKLFYRVNKSGQMSHLNRIKPNSDQILFSTDENFFVAKINVHYGNEFTERKFYQLDLETAAPLEFYDIDAVSGYDTASGMELVNIYSVQNGKVIATICHCLGECLSCEYYLVDLSSNNIQKLDLNKKEPLNDELYDVRFQANDEVSIELEVSWAQKPENNGVFIYDSTFNEISRALDHAERITGHNYRRGKYISDNVDTSLDDGREVIISHKYSLQLARSFYRIYADSILISEDLKKCTKHELDLLKNMVFAKHNYQFQTDFYQAYFNYYEFYNSEEKRKTRVKDVNRLLTESDKQNLALIARMTK